MNTTEKEMLAALVDLKENHNVPGIKISFEDEGLTGEMAQIIASIAFKAGISLSMKIGGCEAKRDMHDAKVLGVNKVVGPMIETPYAMKKFIESTRSVYTEDERQDTKFMCNIETITGFNNLEEMMQLPEAMDIYGIVLGRVDFAGSLGKDRSFVNSSDMEQYAIKMAEIAGRYGKHLFIGGGVSLASLDFFRKLPQDVLACFETRNIIFNAKSSLADPNVEIALVKAMGFELAWMRRKREFYGKLSNAETFRIEMIEKRYQESIKKLGM